MLDRAFGHPLELEEKATAPLAGGIMQYGYQCGMIWGAALAAGAESFRRHGSGPKAEVLALRAAQRVVDAFQTRHDEVNCFEPVFDRRGAGRRLFGRERTLETQTVDRA